MQATVVELNDIELRVARGGEILVRSPGYIVVDDDTVLIGEPARRRAPLHPQKAYNSFWSNLSQDSLHTVTARFRHNADLAFAQLMDIHQRAGKPAEVFFSVPGSFSPEQLSLLLGIVEACPFTAAGLVDSAVAAVSAGAAPGEYRHLDIELHRAVVTCISVADEVIREDVEIITNTGLCAIHDAAAELVTDTFIAQCRFDPQHQAESEQALYDQLPGCLGALARGRETIFEIHFSGVKHRARLTRSLMVEKLSRHYEQILKELAPVRHCLISDRLARLPGFTARLQSAAILDEGSVFAGVCAHAAVIQSEGPALNFVTRLPRTAGPRQPAPAPAAPPQEREAEPPPPAASHLLGGYSAYPLSGQPLYLSGQGRISATSAGSALCSVRLAGGHAVLQCETEAPVAVNGERVHSSRSLVPGDRITVGSAVFTPITVVPDHGPDQ